MDSLEAGRVVSHDVPVGPLKRCQITGSDNLNLVIDLGHQPPCDSLLTKEQLDQPESTYPLRLMHCPESGLAQLDYIVDGKTIYPPEYPYKAGISWPVVEAQKNMAGELFRRFGAGFHVDIGSNDGTLLSQTKALGYKVLGVEPTDIAKLARENNIHTIQSFFTESLARDVVSDMGKAKLITMTNVFAHMASLGEVMRGIDRLLADDGVFVTESHYLLDILQKNQFDTIYHEHVRTYSLKSFSVLFPMYGMEVFDVERAPRYGGNIRAYVGRIGKHHISPNVHELLRIEEATGLHEPKTWEKFRKSIYRQRDSFMDFIYRAKKKGETIAGCSAPGRCATLLNFYGVKPDDIAYLGELQDSLKLGKYLPGAHIPIVSNKRIIEEQPDNLVLMAWHYADPIMARLRKEGVKSRFVMPLPDFNWVEGK